MGSVLEWSTCYVPPNLASFVNCNAFLWLSDQLTIISHFQAETLKEQGNLLELVDRRLGSSFSEIEALRMIEISFLCTKLNPNHRPPMSSVVQMLTGKIPVQYSPNNQESSGESGSYNTNSSMQFRDNEGNRRIDCISSDYSSGSVYYNNHEMGILPSTSISSSLQGNSQNWKVQQYCKRLVCCVICA